MEKKYSRAGVDPKSEIFQEENKAKTTITATTLLEVRMEAGTNDSTKQQ